jgi:hypothetical protein
MESRVTIAGLARKSIREIHVLLLPDGELAKSRISIDSIAAFPPKNTMLEVTASPMPTLILVGLNPG